MKYDLIPELIEKVQKGRRISICEDEVFADRMMQRAAFEASAGSFDMALQLQEKYLPDWRLTHFWGHKETWICNLMISDAKGTRYAEGKSTSAGSAFLVAILKALLQNK
jgi:hypothetical protein